MVEKQAIKAIVSGSAGNPQARTARYIADLVGEMERLARRDGFHTLAESLRAARIEADRISAE